MTKILRKKSSRRLVALGIVGILSIAVVHTVVLSLPEPPDALHGAASTYVVCHAMPQSADAGGDERYYCSSRGCYTDEIYDVRIVGTFQDKATCAGIADSLEEGITK